MAPASSAEHRVLMRAAIEREAVAQRAALAGDAESSEAEFRQAADDYRRSWELAPPRSYGRLVGMLKAAILGGQGTEAARYAQQTLAGHSLDSPTASYAAGLSALVLGDDEMALLHAQTMRSGSESFARAASAIDALARMRQDDYRQAATAIVADFEAREGHLTGVQIADTAAMFERLAAARGLRSGIESALLPPHAAA